MKQKIMLNLVIIGIIAVWAISVLYPINEKINLGLDLKGGMDLIYEVDMDKLKELTIEKKASEMRSILKAEGLFNYDVLTSNDARGEGKDFDIEVILDEEIDPEQRAAITAALQEGALFKKTGGDLKTGLKFTFRNDTIAGMKTEAISKALEVIRNRVDLFGVTEPSIAKSGKDRIRIQLPGVEKAEDAASTIGDTAMLEFKIVRENNGYVESLSEKSKLGKIESDEKIYYGEPQLDQNGRNTGKVPAYVLKKETLLTGGSLEDARVGTDEFGKVQINFTLTDEGSRKFAVLTKNNVGRQLAIVLDDTVISAPSIQGPIISDKARITGQFSESEAKRLAIILKAGALPAPLKKVSEITVGPSLGSESIQKGVKAALIGGLLVFIYMLITYKLSGIIADIALVVNLLLLLAGMALFKATLTLPGIAGIILTIGICVDANVIIFERIKEELRAGKTTGAAIEGGFEKAFSTILDSNVTTILTALVLYMFGTGPVKGFAVTLSLGTAINLFSAVFVVRTIYNILTNGFNIKKISI
ncbi:MAG: protein translocase subunit SecD [Candidatus Muiribacterium halophilum]|uniref:Protein translocase subunit SecD n=1 Tax=Muiribacterium halophilum TaxID=2053465 RepID=A0A2N5ZH65_MUIH1|nr:MAG: protein translocase subunit SecD [Candidatus Muirbacterium halophilum]